MDENILIKLHYPRGFLWVSTYNYLLTDFQAIKKLIVYKY